MEVSPDSKEVIIVKFMWLFLHVRVELILFPVFLDRLCKIFR